MKTGDEGYLPTMKYTITDNIIAGRTRNGIISQKTLAMKYVDTL